MQKPFPTSVHFVAALGGKVALFLRSEGKIKKWDILNGICSGEPDERYAEMVLGQFLPDVAIEKVVEIDLSSKPESQKHFIDGGLYICTVLSVTNKLNPEYVRFTDGSDIPQLNLTNQAQTALSFCLQGRPV